MTHPREEKPANPQQRIDAADGATIIDAVQIAVTGQVTGGVHVGDRFFARSSLEELNDYLARAIPTHEARMYRILQQAKASKHPFKLLYAFDLQDAHIFFGRDAATEELFGKVVHHRLTVLHARSGAGKTSLLNAGLSHRLIEDERLPVYVRTRAFEEDPTLTIKRALAPASHGPWPELLRTLSLQEFLGLASIYLKEFRELVIILDQFEEFLVSLEIVDLQLPFIRALRDCYDDQVLPARFIIALRRENMWDLDEFTAVIPSILDNTYGLLPMTQEELKEAITGPVSQLEREMSFDQALLDILLADLGLEDVELTHLQIVCNTLYEVLPRDESVITLDLYRSLGKAEGILTDYLNDTLDKLPSDKRATAKNILKQLVSSDAGNRTLSLDRLARQVPQDPALLEGILERLVDARLLHQEDETDSKAYELAHAYLAEEIIEWIGRDEIENKRAEELLQRELVSWRVHYTPIDQPSLDILKAHVRYLDLDRHSQTLLLYSALWQGRDVSFWLEHVEDTETVIAELDIDQIVEHLVGDQHLCKRVSNELESDLDQTLRHALLLKLWDAFNKRQGAKLRMAGRALWAFRRWLTRPEQLRVAGVLWPIWAGQSFPFAIVLVLLLLGGPRAWTLLTRERAIPGRWIQILEGEFVMGSDRTEAEFARSMCMEGALDTDDCLEPDQLLQRSGRQVDAWLPSFEIMDNEVTNAQFQQCLDEGICQAPDTWAYAKSDLNKPATGLSWTEAMSYCQWLSARLPTEGEWEKAARGPGGNYFPWGNDWHPDMANLEQAGSGSVQSITQYAKSDISFYGVKNMAGNVREWTASKGVFHADGKTFSNDLFMPEEADENRPVILRGGSWRNERSVGMGSRVGRDPIRMQRSTTGFRCACAAGPACRSPWGWRWIWFGAY